MRYKHWVAVDVVLVLIGLLWVNHLLDSSLVVIYCLQSNLVANRASVHLSEGSRNDID